MVRLVSLAVILVLATVDAKACRAGLSKHHGGPGLPFWWHRHCIMHKRDFAKIADCTTIDYLCIAACKDCDDASFAAGTAKLTKITGKDPTWGYSICLHSSPGITSMKPLSKINNELTGGLVVVSIPKLVDLTGLESIPDFGINDDSISVYLLRNAMLRDITQIKSAALDNGKGKLKIQENPALKCVPGSWPKKDEEGDNLPHGLCDKKKPTNVAIKRHHKKH
jgi:hypothetical protein